MDKKPNQKIKKSFAVYATSTKTLKEDIEKSMKENYKALKYLSDKWWRKFFIQKNPKGYLITYVRQIKLLWMT